MSGASQPQYSPIELTWLDRADARERIQTARAQGRIGEFQADRCREFHECGYCIVRRLAPDEITAAAATAPESLLEGQRHLPRATLLPLLQNGWRSHDGVRALMLHLPIIEWIDLLLGYRSRPLQTLSLPESSQQGAHSDEILMSTRPRGAMAAAWIALEDVQADAGPLQLWPGSHRWSYLSMADIGGREGMTLDERKCVFEERYYTRMAKKVAASGVPSKPVILRRGDVLFWHQGLVHGARHTSRAGATRNSLVVHYAATNAEVYSDAWRGTYSIPDLRRGPDSTATATAEA